MNQKVEVQIMHDHGVNGLSYRSLGKKYKINHVSIYKMIKSKQKERAAAEEIRRIETEEAKPLPEDIKTLKEELRKARLIIELQDLMIDISSKELGIDLRKKHGTRQSK